MSVYLGRLRELLASMRFAIALLGVLGVASVIGTVLRQGEAPSSYINQFGPFWGELFLALQLDRLYSSWAFVLILAFLVTSVCLCLLRHTPKYLADLRRFQENIRVQSLAAFAHHTRGQVAGAPPQAAARMQQQLQASGWRVRLQTRPQGCMLAARRGAAHKLGYIAAHAAIVLICLGGLIDSELAVRAQMWLGGKTPWPGAGLISEVPPAHWLHEKTPSFRASLRVPEGAASSTAVLPFGQGVLLQSLPFAVELQRFIVEHHTSGMPKMFASEVLIHDHISGEKIPARIAVNHPLRHRGLTLYQSGFDDGGSRLTLRAWPFAAAEPFTLEARVGSSTRLNQQPGDGLEAHWSVEYTDLRVLNVEDLGEISTREDAAAAPDAPGWRARFGASLAAMRSNTPQHGLRNIGPSVSYRLRDAAGQAREFHNYMLPVDLGDGVPVFLLGVREQAGEAMRYLRIPADEDNTPHTFFHLLRALPDAALREQAIAAWAGQATDTQQAELHSALVESARRALALFAGQGEGNSARGLQALSDFLERNVPEAEREAVAQVMLRVLSGVLLELAQAARARHGLVPMPTHGEDTSASERTQHFMTQALLALGNTQHYPAPLVLMLQDFDQVQASIFQVSRAPGQSLVYLGCLFLCLGVFAMLYVRDMRLWVWLSSAQDGGSSAQLALSCNRRTLDVQQRFARLAQTLLGRNDPGSGPD